VVGRDKGATTGSAPYPNGNRVAPETQLAGTIPAWESMAICVSIDKARDALRAEAALGNREPPWPENLRSFVMETKSER